MVGGLAGLLLLVVTAVARAEEHAMMPRLRYVVRAPDDRCPDEQSFRTLVVGRLGRDPFVEGASDEISVDIQVTPQAVRGRLTVVVAGRKPAERRFSEAPSECQPLVEALATATALAIDPVRANAPNIPPLPPPTGPVSQDRPPIPTAPAPPPRADAEDHHGGAPEPKTSLALVARVAVASAVGLAPWATMGAEAAVGLERGAFAIFLEGRGETQILEGRGQHNARLEATVLGAALAPCAHVGVFFGCIVGRLGVLQGRAPEVVRPSLGSSTNASIGPRIGVWVPVTGSFAFVTTAELVVPLVRTTLIVDGQGAWTAPAIAGGLTVGLGYTNR